MNGPVYRRASPQVYRMRRAAAATVVVLVAFVGWKAAGGGGGQAAPPTTTSSSTSTTVPKVPACKTGETVSTQNPKQDWATILVDTDLSLPAGYGPPDLHNISDAGFPLTAGMALRGFVMPDLSELRKAAAATGHPIKIIAAYRSYQTQQTLYAKRVDQLGDSEAGSRVARPGHSEHQLGTTIDVTSANLTDVDQSWGATPTGQWIAGNAYKYGFLLSYPADTSDRTCYDFEPWHLRYVGRDEAAAVIDAGVTLREYLWEVQQNGGVPPTTTTSSPASTTTR
ncbi:MAG: peptidase and DD-carboxypeptidase VanY/endolysin [Acidimicrobiales bacterium]|jgi:D-alanyl-D-alanine carboxypeptidase|nr:peptidase and DD-carboxypeptidase VanY/endolysin [Acidimicrobiales bacterium]